MKAKKKPLDQLSVADLGIETGSSISEIEFAPPSERQKGIMVGDVADLVNALNNKGLL